MVTQNEKLDERLRKYKDAGGLTTQQLDFSLWYVRSRKIFFIILVATLAVVAFGTISYSLYQFSYYLIYGIPQDRQNFNNLSSSSILVSNRVDFSSNLSYSTVMVLNGENNNSDLVVAVTNANPRVSVSLSYYFEANGQKFGAAESFVLPGDTKYLVALNQAVPSNSSVNLVVENLNFSRLNRHKISDWDQYRLERFNFLIQDSKFTSSFDSGLSEKINLGHLDFKISNKSAYGYRLVPLLILLRSQGQIVAVNRYLINNFYSGEEKVVQLSWPGRLPSINEVEILPELNILDTSIFLGYSAQ